MSLPRSAAHPVLTCAEARDFETRYFGGDENREWLAMQRAGRGVAAAVADDLEEIGGFRPDGRVLVLAGKGHNGGDALIGAQALLERFAGARAEVVFALGERGLRPLAARAWRDLAQSGGARVRAIAAVELGGAYDVCLDGVFGFQFHPPLPAGVENLFAAIAAAPVRLRAAVDLPSGLSEATAAGDPTFRADVTYATGSVKAPVVNGLNAGRVGRLRYVDLGFFAEADGEARRSVLTLAVLAPLAGLRPADSDKRAYGHVFIVAGSRGFPGAALMCVRAALRSGAGLVTAFVPESLVPAFAARAPEAMWVGWPETGAGGLALEGRHLLQRRIERANALVVGPGLGREPETLALVRELVAHSPVPLVLDADALQPDIARAGSARRILTPHLGELQRVLAGDDFYRTEAGREAVVVVKGRITCVTDQGGRFGRYSPFGGPVLARGGSGDVLSGIVGTLLAQSPGDPLTAACRGVVWHGHAADLLARAHGQVAVTTTQLLEYLSPALLQVD